MKLWKLIVLGLAVKGVLWGGLAYGAYAFAKFQGWVR